MKKNILMLFVCIAQIFSAYCMDNENPVSKIASTWFDVGKIPTAPVKGNNRQYQWEVQAINQGKIMVSLAVGHLANSDNVAIINAVFPVNDPKKELFANLEGLIPERYYVPTADWSTAILDNYHMVYFAGIDEPTDFNELDVDVRGINTDGDFVIGSRLPWYDRDKENTLYVFNTLAEERVKIEGVKNIEFINNLYGAGDSWPRDNTCRLVTFTQGDEHKVLITNTKQCVTLPSGASSHIGGNQLSQDEKWLYLWSDTEDTEKILTYNLENGDITSSREFDCLWAVTSNFECALAYDAQRELGDGIFFVFDLQRQEKISIKGLDQVNQVAKKLGITPEMVFDPANYFWRYSGTNRIVFYLEDETGLCILAIIVDMAHRSAQVFVAEQDFRIFEDSSTGNTELFVSYISNPGNDIKRHTLSKIKLNLTDPIEWVENVELKSLDYWSYLATHENGDQEIIQRPEFWRFSTLMAEYFTENVHQFEYIEKTDRAVIVEKLTKTARAHENYSQLYHFGVSSYVYEQMQRGSKSNVCVTYTNGKKEKISHKTLKKIQDLAIKNYVLHEMDNYVSSQDDLDASPTFRITIRNASTNEKLQVILCDTYRFVRTADLQITHLATDCDDPKGGMMLWHITDQEMNSSYCTVL